jgi:lysozyme family protein
MADFNEAVKTVFKHEGHRFTQDPVDPGGATKYGVSLRWLVRQGELDPAAFELFDLDDDGDIDAQDVYLLCEQDAKSIYERYFWTKYQYAAIGNQAVATKVFDLCVNMGATQVHKLLQRALCALGFPIAVDGVLGPKTLLATNAAGEQSLLRALRQKAMAFYLWLIEKKPKFRKYLKGWTKRALA